MAASNEVILNWIYYDPRDPGSFGGVDRLYREAKNYVPSLKREEVAKWLSSKNSYTLHKPVRRRFKRNRYYVSLPDEQWQIDLADMTQYADQNDGMKYILVVIDIFSKFLWTVILKDKKATTIRDGLQSILELGRKPEKIQSDKGKEFTANIMKKFYKDNDIRFFTSQNEDVKCAVVERVIRTLKQRLHRRFTQIDFPRYIETLQDITHSYNNSYHRTIKMRPVDVSLENSQTVIRNSFGVDSLLDLIYKYPQKKKKISVGDYVRLSKGPTPFNKAFTQQWSSHIHKVTGVNNYPEPLYRVKDYINDEELIGRFYEKEIQKVANTPHGR